MTDSSQNFSIAAPSTVGRYQLQSLLGEGAFGEVYLAKSIDNPTPVAYKMLKRASSSGAAIRERRFAREIDICKSLDHPNVVKVFDHGIQQDGKLFAVYEYVSGQTLRDYLACQRMSPLLVADIMAQVLYALAEAHRRGVIHRDLKPSNIMVNFDHRGPNIKLLDFGVSRHIDDDTNLTTNNETLGTPAYTAPEQLRGDCASEKSDIYSWGLLLYECLTGKPAVVGATYAEICHQQLLPAEIAFPQSLSLHPVCELLRGSLSKNPFKRIGSVEALIKKYKTINFSTLSQHYSNLQSLTDKTASVIHSLPNIFNYRCAVAVCIKPKELLAATHHLSLESIQRQQLTAVLDMFAKVFERDEYKTVRAGCGFVVCFSEQQGEKDTVLQTLLKKVLAFTESCSTSQSTNADFVFTIGVHGVVTEDEWQTTDDALVNSALLIMMNAPPNALSLNCSTFRQLIPENQHSKFIQTDSDTHSLPFDGLNHITLG